MKHLIKNNNIIQSGIPNVFTRENGEAFWGGYQNRIDLHNADGWKDEIIPEYDRVTHRLGQANFDVDLDKVTYPLIEIPFVLADKQKELIEELEVAEDSMERLISRCERVNGTANEGLNDAIATILQVQADTREEIPLLTEEQARSYRIKAEDIAMLISMLEPYKVPMP